MSKKIIIAINRVFDYANCNKIYVDGEHVEYLNIILTKFIDILETNTLKPSTPEEMNYFITKLTGPNIHNKNDKFINLMNKLHPHIPYDNNNQDVMTSVNLLLNFLKTIKDFIDNPNKYNS